MDHDLLVEPLLTWRDRNGNRGSSSLPGLLGRVAEGAVMDFPRLRTHQFPPWCMFLAQLAAIALHRARLSDLPAEEGRWRDLLLAVSDGRHEPWCLIVEDLASPAFFQPPVPEGSLDGWNTYETPDEIDIVVTARGHDVKVGAIPEDDVEAWVYALMTLQTMQGVYGQRKYGIARMNKGLGNRPRVGLTTGPAAGERFCRDVRVLLDSWDRALEAGFGEGGFGLLWLVPWDGTTSLARDQLSPHFIEVCRRVRLRWRQSRVECVGSTSRVKRSLSAEQENRGDVGDPWTPVDREGAALTVGERNFNYQLLAELICGDSYEQASAQKPMPEDTDPMTFTVWAMVRGQGRTEGLRERDVPLPANIRWRLGRPDERAALGKRSQSYVADAARMARDVLRPALHELGPAKPSSFSERVDGMFFDYLFATLDSGEEAARLEFRRRLRTIAWDELQSAIDGCGLEPGTRLERACAAERVFGARAAKLMGRSLEEAGNQEHEDERSEQPC